MLFEIIDIDAKGRGISSSGISIPFTYPGDVIEGEIINKNKKVGKLTRIIKESSSRTTPSCKYFGLCGGCSLQGINYTDQLKIKEKKVRDLFGFCENIIKSPQEFFYRNRMDYAFGKDFSIGLKDNNNYIINIDKCFLMSEKSNLILNKLRHFISFKKLASYKEGIMRHVVIREGKNIDNTILHILTDDKHIFPLEDLWEKLKKEVSGITWSINLSPADRSFGEIQKTFGKDYLLEKLNDFTFKIPIQSFFQTNTKQAEFIIRATKTMLHFSGTERVFDLYSGTGSIGLSLATQAKEVVGIEENMAAANLSYENARTNNIKNYSAIPGKVEDVIKDISFLSDIIILDPPRPGVHKKVLNKIGEVKPKAILYISCNPITQKHDIDILLNHNYQIKKIQPIDMFPHTPHIENIVLLELSITSQI